jgi:uncharacterized Tic20 family protein
MVEQGAVSQASSEGVPPPSKEACTWAMLCHIIGLGWLVVPAIGGVIGTLIIWQIKKDVSPFVNEQGKEAMNFQISMLIYAIVAGLLCFVCVGMVLLPAVAIADIVLAIIAAVKASNGQAYRYPLTIHFIK